MTRARRGLDTALLAAVATTVATAILYTSGSSYLGSYYGTLGLHESQIPTDTAVVMQASLLPLLMPAFLLLILASFASMTWERPPGHGPFYPMPTSEAFAIVLGGWAIKTLADFGAPPEGQWLVWRPRDVLLLAGGIGLIIHRYAVHARRRNPARHGRLTSRTTFIAAAMAWTTVLISLTSAYEGRLSVNRWEAAILAVAWGLTAWLIVEDLRTYERRKAGTIETRTPVISIARGMPTFLFMIAGMALLLAAGIQGNVAAREAIDGCAHIKTIAFEDDNETLWLVHDDGSRYFVRPLPPSEGATRIVAHGPPATLGSQGGRC